MDNPSGVAGVTATEMGADQFPDQFGLMTLYKQLKREADHLRPQLRAAKGALDLLQERAQRLNDVWLALGALWRAMAEAKQGPQPPVDLTATKHV